MAQVFKLPRIGDSLAEATIQEWNVAVGDTVGKDQVVCSVETSKTVVEVPCPYGGVVLHLGGAEGDVIELDEILIVMGEAGESWSAEDATAPPSATAPATAGADSIKIFRLPRIGDSMAEVTIQEWRVAVGDTITADQVVCDAETTKTVVEVPCPYPGTVLHLGGDVGDVIELDEILIVVGNADDVWTGDAAVAVAAVGIAEAAPVYQATAPAAALGTVSSKVKAMLRVRRAAQEQGIDLAAITPTGPVGNVTMADLRQRPSAASSIAVPHKRKRMSAMRKAIGAALLRSATEVPHAAMAWHMDMTNALARRKAIIEELGEKVSMDAVLMEMMLPLLEEFPQLNATVDGEDVIYYKEVNVGFAVGAEEGLVVPVIKNADRLSVKQLNYEVTRLAQAVREAKLAPQDLSGMTCAISNVGGMNVTAGGMSINPLGIGFMLSICKAVQTPVVIEGEIVIRPIALFQITYDHRVFDGSHVAAFFNRLQQVLESSAG